MAKLASDSSQHMWSQRYGDVADQRWWGMAVDRKGHALVAGELQGAMSFSAPVGTLAATNGYDAFVVRLDP